MGWGFITEFAHGTSTNVYPDPGFGTRETEQVFELFTIRHMLKFAQQLTNYYKTNENDITAWEVLFYLSHRKYCTYFFGDIKQSNINEFFSTAFPAAFSQL